MTTLTRRRKAMGTGAWQKPYEGTWMDRPGKHTATGNKASMGIRWVLHRWSDTGDTELRLVEGDGRTPDFVVHETHDLGVTASWEDAILAANKVRRG